MRVAITGGTGFVGRHLARELVARGHEAVLIARGKDVRDESVYKLSKTSFVKSDLSDPQELRRTFLGCDAVAHCAGINREIGAQIYLRVHVEGTKRVVEAARLATVRKIVLLSFLRARPNCGSGYHESKWAAEEIVRGSGLGYTIFKAGVIYGRGEHMLDHLEPRTVHVSYFRAGRNERETDPSRGRGRSRSGNHRFVSRWPSLEQDREHYRAGRNRAQRCRPPRGRGYRKTSALCADPACDSTVARATANFFGRHRGGASRLRCASRGFASSDAL